MKKLLVVAIAVVSLLFVGCAGTTPAPVVDPSSGDTAPASNSGRSALVTVSVEIARAAARVGLSAALHGAGVPPELTAQIMADLRMIADSIIAGEGLTVLHNKERWAVVRQGLIDRLTLVITSATPEVGGVPLIDAGFAKALVTSLVDNFGAAVRRVIPKPNSVQP